MTPEASFTLRDDRVHRCKLRPDFVAHLLRCGTVSGLVFAKVIACVLAASALLQNRERLLRIVNFWFVAIVGWNLVVIAVLNVRS